MRFKGFSDYYFHGVYLNFPQSDQVSLSDALHLAYRCQIGCWILTTMHSLWFFMIISHLMGVPLPNSLHLLLSDLLYFYVILLYPTNIWFINVRRDRYLVIFYNVWPGHLSFESYDTQTDCIARVSPEDGLVVGWIFLHELRYVLFLF